MNSSGLLPVSCTGNTQYVKNNRSTQRYQQIWQEKGENILFFRQSVNSRRGISPLQIIYFAPGLIS
jgi:hypothetical protein